MINVVLSDNRIVAGDRISGYVTYLPTKKILPKTIKVELRWRTEGRGTPNYKVMQSLTLSPEKFSTGNAIPFTFQTPYEGPITYSGALFRVIWEIKTTVKLPGLRFKQDESDYPFTVTCR